MSFRLMAAILDVGEYPNRCRRVAGPKKIGLLSEMVISRSNHDIIFTSGLTAAILILVGVA